MFSCQWEICSRQELLTANGVIPPNKGGRELKNCIYFKYEFVLYGSYNLVR